jgi:hypothetical protein
MIKGDGAFLDRAFSGQRSAFNESFAESRKLMALIHKRQFMDER